MAATLDDLLAVASAIQIDVHGAAAKLAAGSAGSPPPGDAAGAGGLSPVFGAMGKGIDLACDLLRDILFAVAAFRTDARAAAARPPGGGGPPDAGKDGGGGGAGFGKGVSAVIDVLGAAERAIAGFGHQVAAFVAKANPAAVMRFNLALDNLQAVIGRALTPVLERVTGFVRQMGDAFISLSPQAQQFVAAMSMGAGLGGVLVAAGIAAKALLATLGPLPLLVGAIAGVAATTEGGKAAAEAFGNVLKVLGTVIEAAAKAIMPAVGALMPVVNTLATVLGGLAGTMSELAGTVGSLLGAAVTGVAQILSAVLVPALDLITGAFGLLAGAIRTVVGVVKGFLEVLGLGVGEEYDPTRRSATGAAVRQAQFTGTSEFAQRQYASAYGGAAADEIPRESLRELTRIREGIDRIGARSGSTFAGAVAGGPGTGGEGGAGRRIVAGVGLGAAIGSVVPVIGTGLGAAAGGAISIMRELFG